MNPSIPPELALIAAVGALTVVGELGDLRPITAALRNESERSRPQNAREWAVAIGSVVLVGGWFARTALHTYLVLLVDKKPERVVPTLTTGLQTPCELSERDQAGVQLVSGLSATAFVAMLASANYQVATPLAWPVLAGTTGVLASDIPLGLYRYTTSSSDSERDRI